MKITLKITLIGFLILNSCAIINYKPKNGYVLDFDKNLPEVIIIAVSGRCGQPCVAPRDNYDYLSHRGTLDAVAKTIAEEGFTVGTLAYSDSPLREYKPRKVDTSQKGYSALESDFLNIKQAMNKENVQPRIVLLGHSHGVIWLKYFVQDNANLKIDLQIDLDAICFGWKEDHERLLKKYPLGESSGVKVLETCDKTMVSGRKIEGKDVVLPNVIQNLEVQSKPLISIEGSSIKANINYLFDTTPNVRLDGSTLGIESFVSKQDDHSSVTHVGGESMAWVLGKTAEIARAWKAVPRL